MSDGRTALENGLRGSYVLERELGRGGMATVYLARDLKHKRPVALKVLHPHPGAPEWFERRWDGKMVAARYGETVVAE